MQMEYNKGQQRWSWLKTQMEWWEGKMKRGKGSSPESSV